MVEDLLFADRVERFGMGKGGHAGGIARRTKSADQPVR
jgi:hypothetical protein